jgi:signal transduction histidine kinase
MYPMVKTNNELIAEAARLNIENAALRQQLKDIEKSSGAIKKGNIDALVVAREQALRIFTESTADKPYRILIEKIHEGAVTLNEDGMIVYCNFYFANMVNLPLQKVIGSMFKNYIDDPSKKHVEALLTERDVDILKEEIYINTDGEKWIPALMTANSLWLDNVYIIGIILTDLTIQNENKEKLKRRSTQLEEKNNELESAYKELVFHNEDREKRAAELTVTNRELQQLLRLNADKDRFISILAHDLRSPFSSILGFLSLLMENIHNYTTDQTEEYIKIVIKSAQNTFNLLEDLILWTRSQSGNLLYEPQKLIFTQVCKEVLEILKPTADAKSITLNYAVPEAITVFADINMLKTILRNLVSNAIKFTKQGGRIDINVAKTATNITISISDNGIGMEPETVNMLFDISKKHTTKGTSNESGTGLGLFLCKEFVEKHDSHIWVESKKNEGSIFYFTLLIEKPMEPGVPG